MAEAREFSVPEGNPTLDQVLQANKKGWEAQLSTDDYETARSALARVQDLRSWRAETERSYFGPFYRLFESVSAVAGSEISLEAKKELQNSLVEQLTPLAHQLSPRVADLYLALLSQIDGSSFAPAFEMTSTQLDLLRESGDLDVLMHPNLSFTAKKNRMDTRVISELRGRYALDRRDKEKTLEDQPLPTLSTPPPARDQSKPGMDEMQRLKEGQEAPAIWTISPGWGGYYKEQSFDTWDSTTNTWRQSSYEPLVAHRSNGPPSDSPPEDHLVLNANLPPGQTTRIPIPYTHILLASSKGQILMDRNGDFVLQMPLNQGGETKITLVKTIKENDKISTPTLHFSSAFSDETAAKISEVKHANKTTLEKARALASYAMRRLSYSNDSSYNSIYDSHPDGYIAALDEYKKADCDVANTYFAALCAELGIPVRHVVGQMVKGKDASGASRITSGTGHAWTEIWDDEQLRWIRIDATPPGDPQLQEDQKDAGVVPGDYGQEEAIGPTDEELQALEERLAQLTEKLSYTQEEIKLAETTGIDLKEARQIMKEIKEAENTRLPTGERVVDVLSQLFNLIIESRRTEATEYTGPLRKREGGEEIEDIVAHKIGISAGESDPVSRQKLETEEEIVQLPKKFRVRLIGDKSGSMGQTSEGQVKWEMQRKAEYLILSSLHRFSQNLERVNRGLKSPLSVMTEAISFRDASTIDVDKSLSSEFSPQDKVALWKSLANVGWGNGDVAAMLRIRGEIQQERELYEQQGRPIDWTDIVFVCSDGEPVGQEEEVHQLAEELGTMNTVTVGLGLTRAAAKVPLIFNTPHSRGELVGDINDLPIFVAKHVIAEAIKLMSPEARQSAQRIINAILSKFPQTKVE